MLEPGLMMAGMRVLVVDAGAGRLWLRLLDGDDAVLADHEVAGGEEGFDEQAAAAALRAMAGVDAAGHRFAHGGPRLVGPAVLDADLEDYLSSLVDLAPFRQRAALAGAGLIRRLLPSVPAVACADTALHASLPAAAATYAVPGEWRERCGVRRSGLHGLSHAYAARRAARVLGWPDGALRVVTCHLGAEASVAAVRFGTCVDTAVVMAATSETVEPGVLLWLRRCAGLTEAAAADALAHRSGLVALAGSADVRGVLAAGGAGDAPARLVFDVYVHRLRGAVAAMAAAMGGLDTLVFTGAAGEQAAEVRAAAAAGLGFLGVMVDDSRNERPFGDADLSAPDAPVTTLVVRAREDLEIARQVRAALGAASA